MAPQGWTPRPISTNVRGFNAPNHPTQLCQIWPCWKNYALDRKKWLTLFRMVSTSSTHCHAQFWRDRTTRVSWGCKNMVFVCFFCLFLFLSPSDAGALFVRGDIVWTSIVSRFMGRFWCYFHCFSQEIAFSQVLAVIPCGIRWRLSRAPNWEPHVFDNFFAVWIDLDAVSAVY